MPEPIDATIGRHGVTRTDDGFCRLVARCCRESTSASSTTSGRQGDPPVADARDGDLHQAFVAGIGPGSRYGLRADGVYSPDHGLWFDPAKLLVDPYAGELDRPFRPRCRASRHIRRGHGRSRAEGDRHGATGQSSRSRRSSPRRCDLRGRRQTLSPRCIQTCRRRCAARSQRLPSLSIIAHLKRIGVDAVELMPIVAWIDERHLPPLGLSTAGAATRSR